MREHRGRIDARARSSAGTRPRRTPAARRRSRPPPTRTSGWGWCSAGARARGPRDCRPPRRRARPTASQHLGAVALAAGHVEHDRAANPARRSIRTPPGAAGTSSSRPARRAACARRSARAAGLPGAGSAERRGSPAPAPRVMCRAAMEALRTADEIRDVNTRYHDVAAVELRLQVGHRLRRGRPGPGASASSASCSAGGARARVRALARGRRRHRLLQPQPAPRRRRPRGHLHRHLARDGPHPGARTPSAWGSPVKARPGPTPSRCRSPIEASTSCSATRCSTTCPTCERAFAEFHRVLRPGGRIVFAGEPSRVGDRIAAIPKRGAVALAPTWRRGSARVAGAGSREPATCCGERPLARAGRRHPRVRPRRSRAPRRRRRVRRRPPCAARSCSRTGSAGSTARSRPAPTPTTCRCCGASTRSAATCCSSAWTSGCSSRGCRRRSSTTCCCSRPRAGPQPVDSGGQDARTRVARVSAVPPRDRGAPRGADSAAHLRGALQGDDPGVPGLRARVRDRLAVR